MYQKYSEKRKKLVIENGVEYTSVADLSRTLLARLMLLSFSGMTALPASALVTYDGTDGVLDNIFNSNSEQVCTSCHSSSLISDADRSFAPQGVDFDTYSDANTNSALANTRVQAGTMPQSGSLTAGEKSLMQQWIDDGALENAAPNVSTSAASSVAKYAADLNGEVGENGANTSVTFKWGTASNALNNSLGATSPSGTGGGFDETVTEELSGLDCGTTYYFKLEGTSSLGSDSGSTRNFTTSACNVSPTITSSAGTSATEDIEYSYQLTISDSDDNNNGSDLSFALSNEPSGMVVSNTGEITWTPSEGDTSSGLVTVTVTDGGEDGATGDTEDFTITVTAVNDNPQITSTATKTATEDQEYSYTLIISDPDDSDMTNDFTYSLEDEPSGMVVSNSGTVTWTPGEGVSSSGSVTLSVQDGGEDAALGDSEQFTITVTAVNDAPQITSSAGNSATEDIEYSYQVTVDDPDDLDIANDLSFSLSNEPDGMSVSSTGEITWTPEEGVTTSGAVTVTVADGGEDGASDDSEQFTITVTAVNDSPSITSSPSTSAIEDIEYSYQVTVSDPDDSDAVNDFSYSLSNEPSGMLISNSGLLTWTPENGDMGSYDITVIVADGGEDGSSAAEQQFTLNVDDVNDAPSITSTADSNATENVEYQYQLIIDDPDDDNNGIDLTFSLNSAPNGMTVTSTGLITWTPSEGETTSGVVEVEVADGGENNATSDTEQFTLTVIAVDDIPVITSTAVTSATEDEVYSYQVEAFDYEGDALFFSLSQSPEGMTISDAGLIEWVPLEGQGDQSVTVEVSDGNQAATQSFTLLVSAVNDAPLILSPAITEAIEDELYSYPLLVDDPEFDSLSFSLDQGPEGMTLDSNGLIEWLPEEGVSSAQVVFTVSDGALTDSQSFTIQVIAVNDPPVVVQPSTQSLTELQPWLFSLEVSDPDDSNNGSDITFELLASDLPTSDSPIEISSVGDITWLPPELSAGEYQLVIAVSDGLEDGGQATSVTLDIQVAVLDSDQDGLADYQDNCPFIFNQNQLDTDGDELGNPCDDDDDNDGIGDQAEQFAGLDSLNASDGMEDLDRDGVTNAAEFALCLVNQDVTCEDITQDNYPPVISFNSDLVIDALSRLTDLSILDDLEVSADDARDGAVDVTLLSGSLSQLVSGRYQFVWHATDASGNSATATQQVDIRPALIFGGSMVTAENRNLELRLELAGDAPSYPVTATYQISGSSSNDDHNLRSGSVDITDENQATLNIEILEDAITESDETLIVEITELSSSAYLPPASSYTVLIVDRNVAPEVDLSLTQSQQAVAIVYQDNGLADVVADISDVNGDDLTIDWQLTSSLESIAVFNTDRSGFTFNPQNIGDLSQLLTASISVSDGQLISEISLSFIVKAEVPVLSATMDSDGDGVTDADEGLNDSDGDGVADYLDAVNDPTAISSSGSAGDTEDLMRVESGLQMTIGSTALVNDQGGALLTPAMLPADEFQSVGGIFDFQVKGLSEANRIARVVIPLQQSIPVDSRYRKYVDGIWFDFVESATDSLASADKVDGECPLPGSDLYLDGLQRFADCIQLTISDGGPNDADGAENGVILDPGGVSVSDSQFVSVSTPEIPSGKASGSGSIGIWLLGLILTLTVQGVWVRQRMSNRDI
jgi:hypothetical protein